MKLTLYHLATSRSQRILWLLEEFQLNYELVICRQNPPNAGMQQLKQHSASAKFPTLLIQADQQQFMLSESSAIAEFLQQHLHKAPMADSALEQQLQFSFWKNFADASFMPNLALKQIFAQIAQRTPLPLRPVSWCFKQGFSLGYLNQAIAEQLNCIEQHLSRHTWLAGYSFSIADILVWFPLQACAAAHPEFMQYPHCRHYLAQIASRPAFQQALRKGQWSDAQFKQYWSKAW